MLTACRLSGPYMARHSNHRHLREMEVFEGLPPLHLHLRKLTPSMMSLVATTEVQARCNELIGRKREQTLKTFRAEVGMLCL